MKTEGKKARTHQPNALQNVSYTDKGSQRKRRKVKDIGDMGQANNIANGVNGVEGCLAFDERKTKQRKKGTVKEDLKASNNSERREQKSKNKVGKETVDQVDESTLEDNDADNFENHHGELNDKVKVREGQGGGAGGAGGEQEEEEEEEEDGARVLEEGKKNGTHSVVCSSGGGECVSILDLNEHQVNGKMKEKGEFVRQEKGRKKRKKREKGASEENEVLFNDDHVNSVANKEKREDNNGIKNAKSTKKVKKVTFDCDTEVLPSHTKGKVTTCESGLIQGKRFSKEEDELIKEAISDYVERHCLGEEGLQMVMNCGVHPGLRGCWKEIGEMLPWRPYDAVRYRAHILYERGEQKWTKEELELVQRFYKEKGSHWKVIAMELGKSRIHVKDAWRRINATNKKRGRWSQKEYQSLFDLVNKDLRMKAYAEKRSKHGMLRDNISWTAISEKLSTRQVADCCHKWYDSLTSSMVAEGCWMDTDDFRLIDALYELDANCEEDVDWDDLLEHRSGDLCYTRWKQMVRHIGNYLCKPFADKVEILHGRYCPDVLEPKEAYNKRTPVDCNCGSASQQ